MANQMAGPSEPSSVRRLMRSGTPRTMGITDALAGTKGPSMTNEMRKAAIGRRSGY